MLLCLFRSQKLFCIDAHTPIEDLFYGKDKKALPVQVALTRVKGYLDVYRKTNQVLPVAKVKELIKTRAAVFPDNMIEAGLGLGVVSSLVSGLFYATSLASLQLMHGLLVPGTIGVAWYAKRKVAPIIELMNCTHALARGLKRDIKKITSFLYRQESQREASLNLEPDAWIEFCALNQKILASTQDELNEISPAEKTRYLELAAQAQANRELCAEDADRDLFAAHELMASLNLK